MGIYPEKHPHFLRLYKLGVQHTDTDRHTMDNEIKNKLITAMVFLAEDTNGMVIHLNGFNDPKHANNFVKKLMKNSGIEYKSILDLTELPTLH